MGCVVRVGEYWAATEDVSLPQARGDCCGTVSLWKAAGLPFCEVYLLGTVKMNDLCKNRVHIR